MIKLIYIFVWILVNESTSIQFTISKLTIITFNSSWLNFYFNEQFVLISVYVYMYDIF